MKYQVSIDDQSFMVEIESLASRPIAAYVDGVRFEVWPENGETTGTQSSECIDVQISTERPSEAGKPGESSLGPGAKAAFKSHTVNAPIPGVILEVLVKPGDSVVHGQALFVIEAMKMRNQIRAPRAGEISKVLVTAGQTVIHNHPLMEYSE